MRNERSPRIFVRFAYRSCILLVVCSSALVFAQDYPPPCSPNSPIQTTCYAAANGGCDPCYLQYCVDYDVNYGIGCDAYCYQEAQDLCSPARQVITTENSDCTVRLDICSPQYPYYCHIKTTIYDSCTDNFCGQPTYGPYFCSEYSNTQLERPKTNQVACAIQKPRLDRFGPKVQIERPFPIPAGLLLKARYNVLLKQARPGVKCTYTKKFRKFRKGVKV